jgi:D-cysteine desulfhydrase
MGVDPSDAPLFRAYPDLAGRIERVPFVKGPTPVEPFRLEGFADDSLFIKRDDRSCPLYGGNKARKLEFVLGAALARGTRRLVTTGGIGTHHGLATAILGREVGLSTTLVLVSQPVTPEVKELLQLQAAFGAEQLYGGNVPGAALQVLRVLLRSSLRGERPTLVPTGGSSARGNLGFVSAGFELAEQVRAGELPEPAEIFVPVGTGGTAAGLALGLKLAGLSSRVVGVLVTDILPPGPARLARAARASLRLLRSAGAHAPDLAIGADDLSLIGDQLGDGYGSATPAAREAQAAAARQGVRLETTYSAKCLAALRERAARGEVAGAGAPVLFWNTFNGIDVTRAAPRSPESSIVPAAFQRFL